MRIWYIRTNVFLAVLLLHGHKAVSAQPDASSGTFALALAVLVGEYSPELSAADKKVAARLFSDDLNFSFPPNQLITVRAESVVCRTSDIDIADRSCELTFGKNKHMLKGRSANELSATLAQAGVPSGIAAGTIFESVSQLVCTIDPNQVKQKGGGGAQCTFTPGPNA